MRKKITLAQKVAAKKKHLKDKQTFEIDFLTKKEKKEGGKKSYRFNPSY